MNNNIINFKFCNRGEGIMKNLILTMACLGLFAGAPLISNVQAETLNQGQVILADDHGTFTGDNPYLTPNHQENSVTKVGCPSSLPCAP